LLIQLDAREQAGGEASDDASDISDGDGPTFSEPDVEYCGSKAAKHGTKAAGLDPTSAKAWFRAGRGYTLAQDYDAAAVALTKVGSFFSFERRGQGGRGQGKAGRRARLRSLFQNHAITLRSLFRTVSRTCRRCRHP